MEIMGLPQKNNTTEKKRRNDPALAAAQGRMPAGAKRPRTSKACEQCRKQKTRCEPSSNFTSACHRCFTLTIPCSFLSTLNSIEEPSIQRTVSSSSTSPAPPLVPPAPHEWTLASREWVQDILSKGAFQDVDFALKDFTNTHAFLNDILLAFEQRQPLPPQQPQQCKPMDVSCVTITPERRAQFDEIYDKLRKPWDLHVRKSSEPSPFLKSVRYLLASQHCTNVSALETALLTFTVNQGVFQAITASPNSLGESELFDTAFLILSEWMPANPTLQPVGLGDGGMFRDAAIKLCKQVGLDKVEPSPQMSDAERQKMTEKILLWFDVCTLEAMQSITRGQSCGSGSLKRCLKLIQSLGSEEKIFLILQNRINYLAQTLDGLADLTSLNLDSSVQSLDNLRITATRHISDLTSHVRYLQRILAVSPSEKALLSWSILHQHGCHLALLIKSFFNFRQMTQLPDWTPALDIYMGEIIYFFCNEAINITEYILTFAQECSLSTLASFPVSLLTLIGFAAFISFKVTFAMHHKRNDTSYTETLPYLEKVIEGLCNKLDAIAQHQPQRLPARFSRLIRSFLALWREHFTMGKLCPTVEPLPSQFIINPEIDSSFWTFLDLYCQGDSQYHLESQGQGFDSSWLQSILMPGTDSKSDD